MWHLCDTFKASELFFCNTAPAPTPSRRLQRKTIGSGRNARSHGTRIAINRFVDHQVVGPYYSHFGPEDFRRRGHGFLRLQCSQAGKKPGGQLAQRPPGSLFPERPLPDSGASWGPHPDYRRPCRTQTWHSRTCQIAAASLPLPIEGALGV